jgi:hypothetical protein
MKTVVANSSQNFHTFTLHMPFYPRDNHASQLKEALSWLAGYIKRRRPPAVKSSVSAIEPLNFHQFIRNLT